MTQWNIGQSVPFCCSSATSVVLRPTIALVLSVTIHARFPNPSYASIAAYEAGVNIGTFSNAVKRQWFKQLFMNRRFPEQFE